tara:strand:- start:55 stop:1608 length:1554 start_codon:yes stop_codon:yes gene_type:complete
MYFIGADNIGLTTGGSLRVDISDSGLKLGSSGSRVTTILNEDDMASDSDTSLATQQSIKAYVDNNAGGGGASLANGVDNRVVTATGATGLNGEANLTFNGSSLQLNDAGIDIREQYGRINFKKDASTGFVNNYAIFFYNNADQIKGAINFNNSGSRMGFNANGDYQLYLQDGVFYPVTDDDVDLGKSTNKFKDSFFGLVDAENFKINGGQGSDGQVLTSTGSGVAWEDVSGGGSGISNISEDTTPQLGGDLDVNGNKITSASNADVTIEPNGTGDINLYTDKVVVGDSSTNFEIQHRTTTNSLLRFQAGGNTQLISDAAIFLNADEGGAGGSASLIRANALTITMGKNNNDATLTTAGTGDLTLSTNSGTNSGTITIADGANGNISLTPNGTGNVNISNALNINNVSKEGNTVSGSSLADGSSVTLFTVPATTRGFKATIFFKDTSNTEYQIEEVMGYNTGSSVDFTSFGQVFSGAAAIGSLNATNSSGTTLIQFTNGQGSAINYQATISVTHMDLS